MNIWVSYTFKTIEKKIIQKPLNRSWALATRNRIRSPNYTCFDVMWSEVSQVTIGTHWRRKNTLDGHRVMATDTQTKKAMHNNNNTDPNMRIGLFSEIQNQKKWNVTAGYVGSCSTRVNINICILHAGISCKWNSDVSHYMLSKWNPTN